MMQLIGDMKMAGVVIVLGLGGVWLGIIGFLKLMQVIGGLL